MTKLAVILAEANMTQCELAERSGVPRETINKAVNGHRSLLRWHVAAIAWALDLGPAVAWDLIDEAKYPPPLGPRRLETVS